MEPAVETPENRRDSKNVGHPSKRESSMWVVVLAIMSVVVLVPGGSASAMAGGLGSSTSPGLVAAGEAKAAPGHGLQKPGAGQPKKAAASPGLERATRSERDSPVPNLLWLLAGASRRH